MPTKGAIETLHTFLANEIADIISHDIKIIPLIEEWYNVAEQTCILWTAVPAGKTPVESALRDLGERVRVFPVLGGMDPSDFTMRGWVSWGETWIKTSRKEYDLVSAGWTAFWGPPYDERAKVPVLRAEWDQLQYVPGAKEMGEPHWHVDRAIPVSSESGIAAGVAVSAGEIASITADELGASDSCVLRMGQVHLAMAAWEPQGHPQCWQRRYSGDCDQLRDWATKTLRYLKSQLDAQRGFVSIGRSDTGSY